MLICILDDLVNIYNNKYHSTIKMKPVDVRSITYTDFGIENNDEDPKLKVCDHVRISHNNVFTKGYIPNWFLQNFCY